MSVRKFELILPNLDAAVHAAGDTLFIPTALACLNKSFRSSGEVSIIRNLLLTISAAIDILPQILILSGNVGVGAPNAPFARTFASASKVVARYTPTTFIGGGGADYMVPQNQLNQPLFADDGNKIWLAAVTTGAPTPGAACTAKAIITIEYLDNYI